MKYRVRLYGMPGKHSARMWRFLDICPALIDIRHRKYGLKLMKNSLPAVILQLLSPVDILSRTAKYSTACSGVAKAVWRRADAETAFHTYMA